MRAYKWKAAVVALAITPHYSASADLPATTANARTIEQFADLLMLRHQVEAAFETYARADLVQHNAVASDGRAAAISLCKPLFTAPGATFSVAHIVVDGDLAFIHYRGSLGSPDHMAAVAELYRLQDGKLAEHWDAFQPVPHKSANAHPMFGVLPVGLPVASTGASESDRLLISKFADLFYRQKAVRAAFETYVAPDYIQHNPGIADGREAAIEKLEPMFRGPGARFTISHILVGGAYAVIHLRGQGNANGPAAAVFDIYRIANGRIAEHWDVIQVISETRTNTRSPV